MDKEKKEDETSTEPPPQYLHSRRRFQKFCPQRFVLEKMTERRLRSSGRLESKVEERPLILKSKGVAGLQCMDLV